MTINTPETTPDDLRYVGFWPRFGASLIDGLILTAITGPVLTFNYGWSYWIDGAIIMGPLDFLLSYLFPAVATIWFWVAKHATPGKMVVRAKIVDARTGMAPSTGQYVGRYFAYPIFTFRPKNLLIFRYNSFVFPFSGFKNLPWGAPLPLLEL